jgi:predicted glutamine amidotransferase
MCKLFIVTGIKPGKEARAFETVMAAMKPMTARDKDGFGYAAFSPGSGIWGERWLNPADGFRVRQPVSKALQAYRDELGDALDTPASYNTFGRSGAEPVRTIAAHARMATCDVTLENVHPFFDAKTETALIHNGIISNHHEYDRERSSCDSEAILTNYLETALYNNPANLQQFVDGLEGSFACAILSNDGERYIVDIFKNSQTTLYGTKAHGLGGGYIFATTREIIEKARVKHGPVVKFQDNTFLRLDAETGERLIVDRFEHVPRTWQQRGLGEYTGSTFGTVENAKSAFAAEKVS